jgi:hypothetical protein
MTRPAELRRIFFGSVSPQKKCKPVFSFQFSVGKSLLKTENWFVVNSLLQGPGEAPGGANVCEIDEWIIPPARGLESHAQTIKIELIGRVSSLPHHSENTPRPAVILHTNVLSILDGSDLDAAGLTG